MFKFAAVLILISFGVDEIRAASLVAQEYDEYDEYFKCKNGELIGDYQVCNGHKDCTDASDEYEPGKIIASPCLKVHCSNADAKCYYGACIPYTSWCNGIRDCADGSDEWKYFCTKSDNPNQSACESGEFISKDLFCDGQKDCFDGSDESSVLCSLRKRAATQFRCLYGGLINSSKKCNGREDCYDGTDEDEYHAGCPQNISSKSLSPPIVGGCFIKYDKNHEIRNDEYVYIASGHRVPQDTRIFIKCQKNFSLSTNTDEVVRICEQNVWNDDIPSCYKFCENELLTRSISTKVNCKHESTPVACERIRPKTIAEVSCADSYQMPTQYRNYPNILMHCSNKSTWDISKVNCKPICGKTEKSTDLTASDSPWHVGIYARSIKACGGTIISPRLVITALHCVLDENDNVLRSELIQVFVASDSGNGSIDSFFKDVLKIFADTSTNSDVSLLQLATPFILSKNIRPSCTKFSLAEIAIDEFGTVNGWLRAIRESKDSLFKKTKIKTISRNECSANLGDDKFCVRPTERMRHESLKQGQLCEGDSGGGIIVYRDYTYYLIGIISFKPSNGFLCTIDPVAATDFNKIPKMLKDIIKSDEEDLYDH